ncbi:PHB depolymerase family esterase [Streptomyces sp. R28]|uniref:PHB depolymerase family esterase n=1 Tax=Streptomyces sp. R28 TaxID=3238628 RepID=A0AB39PQ69_9ACTN
MMTRTRLLLWPALVAVLLVLGMGGTALGRTAAAPVSTAAASPGCGKAPTLTSGTYTIQSGGKNRSFILRIPDGYDRNRAYRLIFGFHWLGGTSTDVSTGRTVETGTWAYYGLQRLADNSAIFVAPQGLNNGWANSGGGTQPIAYLGVHGLRDSVLGISGGRAMRDTFVRNNGCTPQNPPEPEGSLTHRVTTYSGCSAGHPVAWAAFDEGHIAAPQDGAPGDSGRTWLPGEVWKFFTQFQASDPSPSARGTAV